MKKYLYNYQTIVTLESPVRGHAIMLRCQPCRNQFQTIEEEHLILSPGFWLRHGTDAFENRIVFGGTRELHSTLAYVSTGIIVSSPYIISDEGCAMIYRLPSQFTFPSEKMCNFAMELSGSVEEQALQICHIVFGMMVYQPDTTDNTTTAADSFENHCGVCQDYAHLMISLCRLKGIPARYVNGFVEGTGATHAWVEIYDGYHWIAFDPTNDRQIEYGYLKIAHGRDVADCSVSRGTIFGVTTQQTTINVTLKEI